MADPTPIERIRQQMEEVRREHRCPFPCPALRLVQQMLKLAEALAAAQYALEAGCEGRHGTGEPRPGHRCDLAHGATEVERVLAEVAE